MFLADYVDMYPKWSNPASISLLWDSIDLFDKALKLRESSYIRFVKVIVYRQLHQKKDALQELEYLLEHYRNDEEVYLDARKLKDEIIVSKDKRCFIATAVYAPTENEKIDILRDYRDQFLLKSVIGRGFVSFYYAVSPSIARIISKSQILKSMIRFLLVDPIVRIVSKVR